MSRAPSRSLDILGLEDFSLSGIDAEIDYLLHRPAFRILRERIWKEGYLQGVEETEKKALTARRELVAGPLAHLEAILYRIKVQRDEFLRSNSEEIISLVMTVSRKIVRAHLKHDPEMLAARVTECVDRLSEASAYRIKVNPSHVAALGELFAVLEKERFADIPFAIDGDASVPEGDVVLEGGASRVESICEVELAAIEEMLRDLSGGEKRHA